MINTDSEYQSCIQNSERVSWRLDDLLPRDTVIDFSRRILSDALTGTEEISCLSAEEKLMLNQVRSNSYAHLFLFLEEYAVALAAHRAGLELHGNSTHMRALLRFTEEELAGSADLREGHGACIHGGRAQGDLHLPGALVRLVLHRHGDEGPPLPLPPEGALPPGRAARPRARPPVLLQLSTPTLNT